MLLIRLTSILLSIPTREHQGTVVKLKHLGSKEVKHRSLNPLGICYRTQSAQLSKLSADVTNTQLQICQAIGGLMGRRHVKQPKSVRCTHLTPLTPQRHPDPH